jgi:adenylate cyclase
MSVANLIGAAGVFLFLAYILPLPRHVGPGDTHHVVAVNQIVFGCYAVLAVAVGWLMSAGRFRPIRRWLHDGAAYDEHVRSYVLRLPLWQTLMNGSIWAASEAVFVPLNAPYGTAATLDLALGIALGGITTCGLSYFLAERLLRPVTQAVMARSSVPDPYVPGVKTRLMAAWSLGTGVPVLAIILVVGEHQDQPLSGASIVFLALSALAAGTLAMALAARSVADPVESVTAALAEVEDGNFDTAVPVYDGSQVGKLQSGFNAMVEGLRERERIRDLFGRQVGQDVATQALERGADFDGQSVHAAVLFVDVIGSTALAVTRPPDEVVRILNRFFAAVVEVIDRTGGFVNKFEGDAALCLYGAPLPREDAETCALLAARLLSERLAGLPGLQAAVGVAAGTVVAGNIGASERYEYTVIGDPVNQAARLTELARDRRRHVLVAADVLERAAPDEAEHWCVTGEEVLRGRSEPTRLAELR